MLLSGAYAEYGWDPETGRPTMITLKMFGLVNFSTIKQALWLTIN